MEMEYVYFLVLTERLAFDKYFQKYLLWRPIPNGDGGGWQRDPGKYCIPGDRWNIGNVSFTFIGVRKGFGNMDCFRGQAGFIGCLRVSPKLNKRLEKMLRIDPRVDLTEYHEVLRIVRGMPLYYLFKSGREYRDILLDD